MPIFSLVSHIALRDIECTLGIKRAVYAHSLIAEEHAILRIGKILIATCGDWIGLMPRKQVPITTALGDKIIKVLHNLFLAAPQIDVYGFHDTA